MAEGAGALKESLTVPGKRFRPAQYQPPLPLDRLILKDGAEARRSDGARRPDRRRRPAGLACAIELARPRSTPRHGPEHRRAREGRVPGGALPLGAVVNPRAFRELPRPEDADFPFRGPSGRSGSPCSPPAARSPSHTAHHAQCRELRRVIMRDRALDGRAGHGAGVNVFTGFSRASLLVDGAGGGRTHRSDRAGSRRGGRSRINMRRTISPPRLTALAEGTRGLSRSVLDAGREVRNPQIFALGVKEIWRRSAARLDRPYPRLARPDGCFGGSFMYPLEPNLVALGLVVGLDYRNAALDCARAAAADELHPLFRQYLEGGELVEWGAKDDSRGRLLRPAGAPRG